MEKRILNLECVLNSLSLGQISHGLVRALVENGIDINIFPIMGNFDLSAFDKNSEDLNGKIHNFANKAFNEYNPNNPSLKIWHILGSHLKTSKNNYLLTFHECDRITVYERNILNSFNKIFITSKYTQNVFIEGGVTVPVIFVPMGVDNSQYYNTNKTYFTDGSCCWSIVGKLEKRKNHKKAIQGWIKKFGNNTNHRLHLFLFNSHLKPEHQNQLFADIFNGQKPPFNIQIFGHQPTNSLMNDAFNSTDIIIDLSCAESLSLPSLNMIAMGKHGLIHHNSAFLDWANADNATLIQPNSLMPIYDGIFFHEGNQYNQGFMSDCDENDYLDGLDKVYNRWKINKINEEGKKLRDTYSFKNGVEKIIKIIYG